MENLLLLIFCFLAGVLLHHYKRMPVNTPAVLNGVILHVSLPALTLLSVHQIKLGGDVLLMASMAWLCFGMAAGFFWLAGRGLQLPRPTVGALILTGGLGNTAYFGLPMIEAYFGHQGLASGIVVDQLGSFLVLSTLGIIFAGIYSSGMPGAGYIVRRILLFPPFIALLLALLLIPIEYPPLLVAVLKRMGDTMAPLALLAVGYQLRLGHLAGNVRNLALGLGFKLVLVPILLFLLYVPLFGARGEHMQITLFQSGMPPMITAAILATEHELDPPLATLMVTLGLILSFATLSVCWWLLRWV